MPPLPIRKLLVANRGEIAVRIVRTAHAMGLRTVAVFSDADAGAPFVRCADEAVRLGPAPAAESYLCVDRLVAAARATGADALHPGYGFLAESPDLASACEAAGIRFVGPPVRALRLMGSKREAKRIAAEAGAPVVPGYDGADQSAQAFAAEAERIGFPVLVKASAGGGGKGMRIVARPDELAPALESARREARGAFGDDTLLLERYVERPRHVEIQILADAHGGLLHLFERECSIQRRHQKIVEETPSPAVDDQLRSRMVEAALAVARAVGYRSAGTVELLLSPEGELHFLEMNTRLQVEHPVTELVTGIDIVREQIRIARGEPISFTQDEIRRNGAAIECRLYAEDPESGFLPSGGRIVDWQVPDQPGLRVDSGVATGHDVPVHYDPMLAKLATHGADREEARRRMVRALERLSVQGVATNRAFLLSVVSHDAFARGDTHTHFVDDHRDDLLEPAPDDAAIRTAAVAATLAAFEDRRRDRAVLPHLEPGFRNNPSSRQWVDYDACGRTVRVEYGSTGRGRFELRVDGRDGSARLHRYAGREIEIEDEAGLLARVRVVRDGAVAYTHCRGRSIALAERPRFPEHRREAPAGACTAPMPGSVVKVLVSQGQRVAAGDILLVLEAMKMEHSVRAPADGLVASVAAEGDQVEEGAVLVVVEDG